MRSHARVRRACSRAPARESRADRPCDLRHRPPDRCPPRPLHDGDRPRRSRRTGRRHLPQVPRHLQRREVRHPHLHGHGLLLRAAPHRLRPASRPPPGPAAAPRAVPARAGNDPRRLPREHAGRQPDEHGRLDRAGHHPDPAGGPGGGPRHRWRHPARQFHRRRALQSRRTRVADHRRREQKGGRRPRLPERRLHQRALRRPDPPARSDRPRRGDGDSIAGGRDVAGRSRSRTPNRSRQSICGSTT